MADPPARSCELAHNAEDLFDDVAKFGNRLRAEGVSLETSRLSDFAHALVATSYTHAYWVGRATLLSHHADVPAYDRAFRAHFGSAEDPAPERLPERPSEVVPFPTAGPLDDSLAGVDFSPASPTELLGHKRFGDCSPEELKQLASMIAGMQWHLPFRITGRRDHARRGQLDMRRTLRAAMRSGGDPVRLHRRKRRRTHRRLVLMLDVSRSMAAYSRPLLLFAHGALGVDVDWEAFCFATRLTHLTQPLRARDPDVALRLATEAAVDLDGGTRIGESLKALLAGWGESRILRGSIVLICSDGLELGDPSLIALQMARLRRLAHEVIWLNPLKGLHGYEPLTGAMRAALPHVDALLAGDTFVALEQVAAHIYRTSRDDRSVPSR